MATRRRTPVLRVYADSMECSVVDVYMGYLRRKLSLPDKPTSIFTVRTVGYRLDDAS